MPESIITAVMGLKWGTHANSARDATASAHSTAITTSSRAWGLRRSKASRKGIRISMTISVLVR